MTTGEKIRLRREARGMTRPVLAGLVGRSPDWLKKIETGVRPLNSLQLLVELARTLGVTDLSELTGNDTRAPVQSWDSEIHHVVPAIRQAMRDVSFGSSSAAYAAMPTLDGHGLTARVRELWRLWHRSPRQRSDVGVRLPDLLRLGHESIRTADGEARRECLASTADLYRLVQRLLAHICEPELHALAVERGRALSEHADTPMAVAQAAWSSAVGLCAAGDYNAAVRLADHGAVELRRSCSTDTGPEQLGLVGALQLEAAAAHGLAGRAGDAYRYLDAAAATADLLPRGMWHLPSAFDRTNVQILAVIVSVGLHRNGEALALAEKITFEGPGSVVRRSRLLLEQAQARANRRETGDAVRLLRSAAAVSIEAVALIPWARTLADEIAEQAAPTDRADAIRLREKLYAVV